MENKQFGGLFLTSSSIKKSALSEMVIDAQYVVKKLDSTYTMLSLDLTEEQRHWII